MDHDLEYHQRNEQEEIDYFDLAINLGQNNEINDNIGNDDENNDNNSKSEKVIIVISKEKKTHLTEMGVIKADRALTPRSGVGQHSETKKKKKKTNMKTSMTKTQETTMINENHLHLKQGQAHQDNALASLRPGLPNPRPATQLDFQSDSSAIRMMSNAGLVL